MYAGELILQEGETYFLAAYNGVSQIKEIDREAGTVVISGPSGFVTDASTNRLRTRVRLDIFERMAFPVIMNRNVIPYDLSMDQDGSDMRPRVKTVPDATTCSSTDDFPDFYTTLLDDKYHNQGLFRDAEHLPMAPETRSVGFWLDMDDPFGYDEAYDLGD